MLNKYITEIKNRIFLIGIMWSTLVVTCFFYKETLLFLSIKPNLSFLNKKTFFYFIATNLTDIFSTYLQICYFITNQIVLIYLFYHILIFLTPGLYKSEYKNLKIGTILYFSLWIFGLFILNKLLLPFCWNFFLSFQNTIKNQAVKVYFEAKITEYVNFYIILYSICNINCQFFLLIFIFIDNIHNKIHFIKNSRKIFYFIFFIVATIITPPDVFSQLLLGISFIVLYEFILIFIFLKNSF